MIVKAYGTNVQPHEYTVIKNMASVLTGDSIEIFDTISHQIKVNKNDILLLFGPRAVKKCATFRCLSRLEFPAIHFLCTGFGEEYEVYREEAFEKLLEFKKELDSDNLKDRNETEEFLIQHQENPLQTFSNMQVQELIENLEKQGIEDWTGTLKDGKSWRVTIKPSKGNADIEITLAELYILKEIRDFLQSEEPIFVCKSNNPYKKNNS